MKQVGVGLRTTHYDSWLDGSSRSPGIVEMITENVLGRGGRPRAVLERLRADGDICLHGVSLSIGGLDPLDRDYLQQLASLVSAVEPRFVSDHVCFGRVGGVHGHDLWPLPMTEESLANTSRRIGEVQEALGVQIALENVSSYLVATDNAFEESAFLVELAQRADCKLLVDVNNVVVSSHNHGFDAAAYIRAIPKERVAYMHTAGHSVREGYRFDDHASEPGEEANALLKLAWDQFGDVPCIFEWDENLPSLEAYLAAAKELQS